jgi:hypothetical protein
MLMVYARLRHTLPPGRGAMTEKVLGSSRENIGSCQDVHHQVPSWVAARFNITRTFGWREIRKGSMAVIYIGRTYIGSTPVSCRPDRTDGRHISADRSRLSANSIGGNFLSDGQYHGKAREMNIAAVLGAA